MQGEGQIIQFLKFWRTKTDTGKLLRVAIAWLQLHTGVGFSLLDNVTTVVPHLAARWLPSLRMFLASINGTIQLDQTYVPPPYNGFMTNTLWTLSFGVRHLRLPKSRS
jgi:hypothetical protein